MRRRKVDKEVCINIGAALAMEDHGTKTRIIWQEMSRRPPHGRRGNRQGGEDEAGEVKDDEGSAPRGTRAFHHHRESGRIPRWRIVCPGREYQVMTRFAETEANRARIARLLNGYMAWRMATGYILAGQTWLGAAGTRDGDEALFAVGVTRSDALGAMCRIRRKPELSFSEIEWLDGPSVDEWYRLLLPLTDTEIDPDTMREIRAAFDTGGEFDVRTVD